MVSETIPAAAPAPLPPRSRRRWLRALIATLLLIFVVLPATVALLAWWLATSESGARTLASQVENYLPAVKLRGVQGAVTGPLKIAEIDIDTEKRTIVLSDVELDWDPRALLDKHLHIHRLHAAKLAIESKNIESPPLTLPEDLNLPITIAIDAIEIDRATIAPVELSGVQGSATYDGTRYRIDLRQLALKTNGSPPISGAFSGKAALDSSRPFAIEAGIAADAKGNLDERAVAADGTVKISGSLERLAAGIDLNLRETKATARAKGEAILRPFGETPFESAALKLQGVDLASLVNGLPHTRLDADIDLNRLDAGTIAIINREPGLYDRSALPVRTLSGRVDRSDGGFRFDEMIATLGGAEAGGQVSGRGSYKAGTLALDLALGSVDLRKLDGRLRATHLGGRAQIKQVEGRQEFTVSLTEPLQNRKLSLDAHGVFADAVLAIDRAELAMGQSSIAAKARVALGGTQSFSAEGRVRQFRLRDVGNFAKAPDMLLNGDFTVSGARLPSLATEVAFAIRDSQLAGYPLTGEGKVEVRGNTLNVQRLALASGANRINAQGALSERDSQLTFAVVAPQIEQLGAGYKGSLEATGTARGTLTQPRIVAEWKGSAIEAPGGVRIAATSGNLDVTVDPKAPLRMSQAVVDAKVRGLQTSAARAERIDATVRYASAIDAPLSLLLDAGTVEAAGRKVETLKLAIDGTAQRHAIDLSIAEKGQRWAAHAKGGVDDLLNPTRWQGVLDRFDAAGTFDAKLADDAALDVARDRIAVEHLKLQANGATIDVERFIRDAGQISTRGRIDRLEIAKVIALTGASVPVDTDLIIDGQWDVTVGQTWEGKVTLDRRSGDVKVKAGADVALGLRTLHADAAASNGRLTVRVLGDGQQLGRVEVDADTAIPARGRFSIADDAAVKGHAILDVPSIAWIGPLVSPTLTMAGDIKGDVTLGGTFGAPSLDGKINGSGLRFTMADAGVDLRQGVLDSTFTGTRLQLTRLEFASANGGTIKVAGPIDFAGGQPSLQLALNATRYQLLNSSDRKLVISGDTRIVVAERRLKVSGAIDVDSGAFDIGRTGAPSLSDDVVIVGKQKKGEGQMAVALDVRVKLGDGITLSGRGLDALLRGEIRLLNDAGTPLQAQGTLNVEKGTYTAYGQKLAIEQGLLRFTGPLNNPALSILAMRRGQEVEAGVSVRGTVLVPRVTLVSEPSVADAEKLSWLVLGRSLSSAGSTDMDALQRAAGLLLTNSAANGVSSQIATAFGLDTLSVGSSKDTVQQRIVTVGKRISSRLYVSYQKGLETASNTLLLRYTLSPRLTVEAETGSRSVLSLFYNIAFD